MDGHGNDDQLLLSDTKFQSTIRGWGDKAQQRHTVSLLVMTDVRRVVTINTLPKKKRGPVKTVRKRKKKKQEGGELLGSPHRSLRPRHKKITYHLPSSDEDDMTDSKLSPKTTGFLYVSTDPRRVGITVGGETFILTMTELKILLEIQRDTDAGPTDLTDDSPGGISDDTS